MVFVTIQRAAAVPRAVEEPPRVRALVAARDIPLHTVISKDDVTVGELPPDSVPEDGLTDPADAVGQLTTADIARGEVVLRRRLIAPDYVGPKAAFVMDPKQVIIAFPTGDLLSSLDVIRPGDRVDIMLSFDFSKAKPEAVRGQTTFMLLQSVRVAALVYGNAGDQGQQANASRGPAQAMLLAVDPQDALTIKYFRDAGAAIDLALRSPSGGEERFDVVPVDGDYLMQRFRFRTQAVQ